jgi:hypothetical protein
VGNRSSLINFSGNVQEAPSENLPSAICRVSIASRKHALNGTIEHIFVFAVQEGAAMKSRADAADAAGRYELLQAEGGRLVIGVG